MRYLYKEHIIKRRMRVQRELDHDKLGLKHIQFIVTFDPEIEPLFHRGALLSGVWEELYVNTAYPIIPDNLFFLDHLAPPSLHPKLRGFYRELEGLGAARVLQTYNCTRLTHSRMWVEDYNWELPGWDFDWSSSSLKPPENVQDPPVSEPVKLDKIDLLMVKRLQYDYDQRVSDVASRDLIDRSTASWHFRKHVEARGLFADYRISWVGTVRDTRTGYVAQRQSFVGINFIAKDLSAAEMMNVRAHLHSIPYLWSEEVGDSDYNAETFIPLQSLMEAFGFFGKVLRPLGSKAKIFTVDQSGAANYAIHPHLFDEESKRWVYKGDLVLEGIRRAFGGITGSGRKERKKGEGAALSPVG
ncbi:MAG: hypothetical protein OK455_04740 [Thaumarchaeota archaeon]|nr:hypothetical protein [Nitrososphaerota archaeon]